MAIPPRFLVVLWLFALAPVAWADGSGAMTLPVDPNALEHFSRGNRLYRLRKFGDAMAEYQAGAMIEPTPVFDYNLGQCYRQIGKYTEAIWHYERFLKNGQPDNEQRASVTAFVIQMRAEQERRAMTQQSSDSASDPPPGQLRALSTSSPPADRSALPQVRAQPTPPPEHHRMPLQRKLAIGAGTLGVALIGLGVGFGVRAESFEDEADAICPMRTCDRAVEATQLIDRGKANALYANVAFGVGGAAALSAVVLWITGAPHEVKSTALAPQISGSFTGVTAFTRF